LPAIFAQAAGQSSLSRGQPAEKYHGSIFMGEDQKANRKNYILSE